MNTTGYQSTEKKLLQGLICRRPKPEMVSNGLDGLQHILENIVSILRMSTKTRNADILLLDVSACMYVVYGTECFALQINAGVLVTEYS